MKWTISLNVGWVAISVHEPPQTGVLVREVEVTEAVAELVVLDLAHQSIPCILDLGS